MAAWMMMKRGCPVTLLHFDSRPYADAIDQSMRCAEVLVDWTAGRKIDFITIPIGPGNSEDSISLSKSHLRSLPTLDVSHSHRGHGDARLPGHCYRLFHGPGGLADGGSLTC